MKPAPVIAGVAVAAACLFAGIFIWHRQAPLTPGPAGPSPSGENSASEGGALIFAGGVVCEGLGTAVPPDAWQVTCGSQRLPVSDGRILSAKIPSAILLENPTSVAVEVPGWSRMEVAFPTANASGDWIVSMPLRLRRETSRLSVAMPQGGSDYDMAEIEWLRPHPSEPLATAPREAMVIPLTFKGTKPSSLLPTGIYRLTLKSRTPHRIRDFVLISELLIGSEVARPALSLISLPPSLTRSYVGLADSTPDPQDGKYPIGFFCGISIDVRKNSGETVLAFESLRRQQTLRYGTLRPRPDTVWPVSNLYLADPVHLTFDCPLSHADHRLTLDVADGRATLLPEVLVPDDRPRTREALERMRTLIQTQARESSRRKERFDPRYANLPAKQLPNYENLQSEELYARHLARVSRAPAKPIDVGAQVTVRHREDGSWSVSVLPHPGPTAP